MSDGVFRIPPSRCENCGATRDAIAEFRDDPNATAPRPGDPILCLKCGYMTTVDEHGHPARFTEAQMQSLLEDDETMQQIMRDVVKIRSFAMHRARQRAARN